MQQAVAVKVLDLPVRVFHWVLAALFCFSWWSGMQGGDPQLMTYHLWSGYSIFTLLLFRIAWGFVGSTHARFSDFLYGPGCSSNTSRGCRGATQCDSQATIRSAA